MTDSVAPLAATASDADIVVNNAGIIGALSVLDSDLDEVREVFDTNYFAAHAPGEGLRAHPVDNGGGALVDVASVLAWLRFRQLRSFQGCPVVS